MTRVFFPYAKTDPVMPNGSEYVLPHSFHRSWYFYNYPHILYRVHFSHSTHLINYIQYVFKMQIIFNV